MVKVLYDKDNFYEKRGIFGVYHKEGVKRFNISLELIKSEPAEKILDAGCGDGFFVEKIKMVTKAEVYGVDISQKAIDIATSKGIQAIRADLEKPLPFNDEYFDIIHCGEIIEHLVNPDAMLREFNRLLKHNKILVISTPNLACWYNRILLLLGFQPIFEEVSTLEKNLGRKRISRYFERSNQPVGHLRVFTLSSIKDLLKIHGFIVEKSFGAPFLVEGFISSLDNLFSLLPSLATIMILKARKVR